MISYIHLKLSDLSKILSDTRMTLKVIDAKTVVDRPKGPKGGGSKIAECIVGDQTASILFQARDDQGAYIMLIAQRCNSLSDVI